MKCYLIHLAFISAFLCPILIYFLYLSALVTSALRTFQTHACDGQLLQLNCKPNTVVSILFAQYGFSNGQICPNSSSNSNLIDEDTSRNCTESLRVSSRRLIKN